MIYGKVSTSFANTNYIMDQCDTPIPAAMDPDNGKTCIQIEHAGQAYHNYMQYLTNWVDNTKSGNTSTNLTQRPGPVGIVRKSLTGVGDQVEKEIPGSSRLEFKSQSYFIISIHALR